MRNDHYEVRKKGIQIWKMMHEANSSSSHETLELKKFGSNMYLKFEVKSKALPKVNFGQAVYFLKFVKLGIQYFKRCMNQS